MSYESNECDISECEIIWNLIYCVFVYSSYIICNSHFNNIYRAKLDLQKQYFLAVSRKLIFSNLFDCLLSFLPVIINVFIGRCPRHVLLPGSGSVARVLLADVCPSPRHGPDRHLPSLPGAGYGRQPRRDSLSGAL